MVFRQQFNSLVKLVLGLCLLAVTVFVLPAGSAHAQAADTDGDGIINPLDNCPTVANPGQEDSNNDGIGDICAGPDGDGVVEPFDNCPTIYNPDQKNSFGDSRGDVCEKESGQRLNGIANKIVVYQMDGTQEIQFYSAAGQKLGATTPQALQNLAARGAGASLNIPGDSKNTLKLTYLGRSEFEATSLNASGTAGDSTNFNTPGITGSAAAGPSASTSQSSPSASTTYTVKAGDSLSRIAARLGVSLSALIAANKIQNPSLIRVGQVLVIPG